MAGSPLDALADLAARARAVTRHDGVFWRRMAYFGAAHMPLWWRRYTPAAFGAAACALLPRQREIVARNLRTMGIAGSSVDAEIGALRTFLSFAECLTDGLESMGRGLDGYHLASTNDQRFKAAIKRGRGVVLLTAHTGSWEVIGRLIGKNHGAGVTMVMTEEQNSSTRSFADALRTRDAGDLEVTYVGGDPLSALPLLKALRAGRIVALQFDRVPRGMASVSVPFFGVMQPFPVGPFKLAQVTGAPLLAAFTRRTGYRTFAVDIPEAIEIGRGRSPAADEAVRAAMARVGQEFERFVRRYPSQWFHFEPLSEVPVPTGGEREARAS